MTETLSRSDMTIRTLRESDLPAADHILRSAFNTFVGVPDLFGDTNYVRTRWLADPDAALAAEHDGRLVGSNFVTRWGTVGFFGPLSVPPELWDRGIASQLMEATIDVVDRWGTSHAGLFTFAHSPKHPGLYQKFGFSPRYLTPIMVHPVSPKPRSARTTYYTELSASDRERAVQSCKELTDTAYDGLDLTREIRALEAQGLGEVVLIDDETGVVGMAICHLGAGSEAGSGRCYIKFGLALPGTDAPSRFNALLDACESLAAERGAAEVELGVNAGRHEAYAAVAGRGYRTGLVGVSMHRHNDRGYSHTGVWLIDDWR